MNAPETLWVIAGGPGILIRASEEAARWVADAWKRDGQRVDYVSKYTRDDGAPIAALPTGGE